MEAIVKAKKIGGSIAVVIPKKIIEQERISPEDTLKIRVEKTADFNWLWGRFKTNKSTDQIMREIDEGELDD